MLTVFSSLIVVYIKKYLYNKTFYPKKCNDIAPII